jgi:hypothetical protein
MARSEPRGVTLRDFTAQKSGVLFQLCCRERFETPLAAQRIWKRPLFVAAGQHDWDAAGEKEFGYGVGFSPADGDVEDAASGAAGAFARAEVQAYRKDTARLSILIA